MYFYIAVALQAPFISPLSLPAPLSRRYAYLRTHTNTRMTTPPPSRSSCASDSLAGAAALVRQGKICESIVELMLQHLSDFARVVTLTGESVK